jgi:AmiR/NasT family two-component response regulator
MDVVPVHDADKVQRAYAAMESRTVIDLATGAIMAQNRCGQETAFDILRRASIARNEKLNEVAAGVVASLSDAPVATHFDD